jgi:hypothetical protein
VAAAVAADPRPGVGDEVFDVEPERLRTAAKDFHSGSDAVSDAAEMISMLRLDASALGAVDAAAEFADALARFTGEHGDDLRRGAVWVGGTAENLVSGADAYERLDSNGGQSIRSVFGGGAA